LLGIFERKENKKKIDRRTPIAEVPYVVVDTELTGLDERKDSIVSIGAIQMTGSRIELGNTFYRLVSPRTELSAASVVIHEITPSDVKSGPDIASVLAELLEFCGDAVLVGHFIAIDLAFLNRELKRMQGTRIENPVLDTFSIYEWLRKRDQARNCPATRISGFRLYDIVKCFDIPVNGAHNAVMDAYITAQLLQRFISLLSEGGVENIGDLLDLGIPFEGGDRFGLSGEFSNF
jgi:DNA polymerase-3 subunit epsilon